MRRKSYRKPYRARKRKSIFRSKLFWFFLLFFLLTDAVSYFALFSEKFQLKEIKISGNQKIQTEEIERLVKNEIQKKLVFSETQSIFLADSAAIVKSLLKNYPLIETAEAKKILPTGLKIEIKERTGVGVWCRQENCFSIDRTGVIFEKKSPEGTLVIRDESGNSLVNIGEKVVPEKLMDSILRIYQGLEGNLKIDVKEIVLPGNERITVRTMEGWEIYFSNNRDVNWQITKLKLVLEKEIPSVRRGELEYIELRFGNLAPYRYKNNMP